MGSSLSAVFTRDVYARLLVRNREDAHYVKVTRWATICILGIGFAYIPFISGKDTMLKAFLTLIPVFVTPLFINAEGSPFNFVDLFQQGPGTVVSWTSSYSDTGVLGEPELASVEKGKAACDEAVNQLVELVRWFHPRPKDQRKDHHRNPPTIPIPWKQRPIG